MPAIETLLLCNHAEAFNGLLYLSGAGWTDVQRPSPPNAPPPVTHFGIGLSVLFAWAETNRRYHLRMWIEREDGGEPVVQVEADVEQGRPAGLPAGSDLRSVLAINADVAWPQGGGYRLLAQLDQAEPRSVSFRVHDVPAPPVPMPGAA